MTAQDLDNLDFLLSLGTNAFGIWYRQASEDDRVYAMELLTEFTEEHEFRKRGFPEADAVIRKFTLN